MADSTSLQCVKENITKLLPILPSGCYSKTLERWYKQEYLQALPFKTFNFDNRDKFLASIPDVVKIKRLKNGEYVIIGAANETAEHIEHSATLPNDIKVEINELVERNPTLTLNTFLPAYKFQFDKNLDFQQYGFTNLEECLLSVPGLQVQQLRDCSKSVFQLNKNIENQPVHEMADSSSLQCVKENIRKLLPNLPPDCYSKTLERWYKDEYRQELPFKRFKFDNRDKFLASIPDVVKIKRLKNGEYVITGAANETAKHIEHSATLPNNIKVEINELVERNPTLTLNTFLPAYKFQFDKSLDFRRYRFTNLEECLLSVPGLQVQQLGDCSKTVFQLNKNIENQPVQEMPESSPDSSFFRSFKDKIRQRLIHRSSNCYSTYLDFIYKRIYGQELSFLDIDFEDENTFSALRPDALPMQLTKEEYASVLKAIADETTEHSMCVCEPVPLPDDIKVKIKELVEYNPNLTLDTFLPAYKAKFGKSFDFQQYWYKNLEECLRTVPGLQVKQLGNFSRTVFQLNKNIENQPVQDLQNKLRALRNRKDGEGSAAVHGEGDNIKTDIFSRMTEFWF